MTTTTFAFAEPEGPGSNCGFIPARADRSRSLEILQRAQHWYGATVTFDPDEIRRRILRQAAERNRAALDRLDDEG